MSNLKVRRIQFQFDGVDFIWNPDNPHFSIMMNAVSFFAIALEKYFCKVIREADSLIKDPAVREEARLFVAQEGAHSLAHRKHVAALIDRYPGLQEALDGLTAHFDKLYEKEELAITLDTLVASKAFLPPHSNCFWTIVMSCLQRVMPAWHRCSFGIFVKKLNTEAQR